MSWNEIPKWAASVTETLLKTLKERDPYTYGHSCRVAFHATFLAQAAGLNEAEQRIVEFSSLFHDLGKIGIPDHILLKPGRLTPDEEAIMREHPTKSSDIMAPLSHIPFFRSTLPGIRYHHERIDGLGYPDGIRGEDIPFTARVLLIADTFDAMTTTRPYRKGLPNLVAYRELQKYSNTQFDAKLVSIFTKAHPLWQTGQEQIEKTIASMLKKAA